MAKKEDNLQPFTSEQSREEAVKNGKKGGIASGKARKQKNTMCQSLLFLMNKEIPDTLGAIKATLQAQGYENPTFNDARALAVMNKAAKGDVKANEYIDSITGVSPVLIMKQKQLKLDKHKFELEVAKVEQQVQETTQGEADNSFVEALNSKASVIWNEEEDTGITAEHSESEEGSQD